MVIETVVNGGLPTLSALMNPNGIPAIAQGCRAGEVTLGDTPPGDTNRNAVAAVDGIDPQSGMGNERVGHNRLAVGGCGDGLPRVGARSSAQPWAGGRNAVGVGDRLLARGHGGAMAVVLYDGHPRLLVALALTVLHLPRWPDWTVMGLVT
jgi:hypothetical protein